MPSAPQTSWVPTGEPTSLGIANSEDLDDDPTFRAMAERFQFAEVQAAALRDNRLLVSSDRWIPGGDDPVDLVPGDLPIIRGIVAGAHLNELQARLVGEFGVRSPDSFDMPVVLAAQVAALTGAVPFYVDGPTAMGLLSSEPPDDEVVSSIRLPFPSVYVGFGREIELPIADMKWPDIYEERVSDTSSVAMRHTSFATLMEPALLNRGGAITGMVLMAGPDGEGLSDFVLWVVSANPDPTHPVPEIRRDRQRSTIIGYRHRAIWRHLIDNVAAAVAWLDWTEPEPLDLPDPTERKAWRKAVRTSQFRKREPRGAAAGVRTIALRDVPAKRSNAEATTKHASPISHIRRGHWRSVRIATRDSDGNITGSTRGELGVDWVYQGRWVAPTVVNPGGTPADRLIVYRIPTRDDVPTQDI